MNDLKYLLAPESVALLGASNREGTLGYIMIEMIKRGGYKGEVYPINPKYSEICGMKCYPDLKSIGHPVDTVVFCMAAKRIEEQAKIAIENGAKSFTIFADCVLEDDDPDDKLEDRLIKMCNEHGIPMLGHNSMGYYNNDIDLRVCGFNGPDEGMKGNVAMVSQSGSAFFCLAHNEPQLKFNFLLATGTGQVTNMEEYLIYALNMETTKVLAVYMESSRNPEKLCEAFELAAKKKIPVVIMKVGRTELGAEFARSHTGGLAGDDDAIQAIFDHYGVMRADTFEEFVNLLLLFSYWPNPPKEGGLALIAESGGERNLIADYAEDIGLKFPALSAETMERLEEIQDPGQHAANPLDAWGTGIEFEKLFGDSLGCMLSDENVALGVIDQDLRDDYFLSRGLMDSLRIGMEQSDKPVAMMTNLGGQRRNELTEIINSMHAPLLVGALDGMKAIKKYLDYRKFEYASEKESTTVLSEEAKELLKKGGALLEQDSLKVLSEAGVPVPSIVRIYEKADIEKKRGEFSYPLVLKTSEEGILHKSDVGGVVLNIQNEERLLEEYEKMSKRLGPNCIAVPMASYDMELILGMKIDPNFGPMAVVGAGGIFTELLRDKMIVLPECTKEEVKYKLEQLKIYKLLCGYRGSEPVDLDALVDVIYNFAHSTPALSEYVSEVDVNPLALKGKNILALDGLIVCK